MAFILEHDVICARYIFSTRNIFLVLERGSETARSCGLCVNKLFEVGEGFEKINCSSRYVAFQKKPSFVD